MLDAVREGCSFLKESLTKTKTTTLPPLPSPRTTCCEMFSVPTHNWSPCYLGLLRVTNINTRLMAIRRSLREVIANIASWALFSRGNTANSHQYQAGPLGLLCKRMERHAIVYSLALPHEEHHLPSHLLFAKKVTIKQTVQANTKHLISGALLMCAIKTDLFRYQLTVIYCFPLINCFPCFMLIDQNWVNKSLECTKTQQTPVRK